MLYRFIFSKERRVAQRLIDVRRFEIGIVSENCLSRFTRRKQPEQP